MIFAPLSSQPTKLLHWTGAVIPCPHLQMAAVSAVLPCPPLLTHTPIQMVALEISALSGHSEASTILSAPISDFESELTMMVPQKSSARIKALLFNIFLKINKQRKDIICNAGWTASSFQSKSPNANAEKSHKILPVKISSS